jgi:hypothetical protein
MARSPGDVDGAGPLLKGVSATAGARCRLQPDFVVAQVAAGVFGPGIAVSCWARTRVLPPQMLK